MALLKTLWRCVLFLMVTGANVTSLAAGFGEIVEISASRAHKEEPYGLSNYHMFLWRKKWKDGMVFTDDTGNKIKGCEIGMEEFRNLLERAIPSFPDGWRQILEEWLLVHRLGFGSRRAKKLFKMIFGWPPGLTFIQGATTSHWSVMWTFPRSIFRLVRIAPGKWRREFCYKVLRSHNEADGVPLAARQHLRQLIPYILFAHTPVGKTAAMQWCNSVLANTELSSLSGPLGQPTQWQMLPLCLRYRLARVCVLTWTTAEMEVPSKVKEVLSDWLGITEEGVAAMAYRDFNYRDFLK